MDLAFAEPLSSSHSLAPRAPLRSVNSPRSLGGSLESGRGGQRVFSMPRCCPVPVDPRESAPTRPRNTGQGRYLVHRDRFHRDHDRRSKPVSNLAEERMHSLEKCGPRLRRATFCSMQASSGDCRFFRQSAVPWPVPSPSLSASTQPTTPRIYAITAPLPPPMLHCASAYGYRFPVASSFQSQHRDTPIPFALKSFPYMLFSLGKPTGTICFSVLLHETVDFPRPLLADPRGNCNM